MKQPQIDRIQELFAEIESWANKGKVNDSLIGIKRRVDQINQALDCIKVVLQEK